MKPKSLYIYVTIITAAMIILSGCEYKDPTSGITIDYTGLPGNTLSGVLTLDGSPYKIDNDMVVPQGSVLRLEPGVEIAFSGFYTLTVEGAIQAVGAPDRFIKFGSTYNNNIYERGNWNGIVLKNPNQTSIFEYCRIEDGARFYQGDSLIQGAIVCRGEGTSPIIRKCALVFNGWNAVYADSNSVPIVENCTIYGNAFSGVVADNGSRPMIKNCIITGNDDYGVFALINTGSAPYLAYNNIWDNFTLDLYGVDITGFPGNISQNPQLAGPDSGDFYDRFRLQSHSPCIDAGDPAGTIDYDGTLPDMGVFIYPQVDPSELRGSLISEDASYDSLTTEFSPYTAVTDIWVPWGDTLIIKPGVEIRFKAETEMRFSFIDSGTVIAKGTESNPITFTSSRSIGAFRGDWNAILLTASPDTFEYCIIEYASTVHTVTDAVFEKCLFNEIEDYVLLENSANNSNINCTFDYCVFEGIGLAGIQFQGSSNSTVSHCMFDNNEAYGIHFLNAGDSISIVNNLFLNNTINGIRCEDFSSPQIIYNTFVDNGYHGIICVENSNPVIKNNIIAQNGHDGIRCQESSNPYIEYNDIWGNSDFNFHNCPIAVGKWTSQGIGMVQPGHDNSSWCVELYNTIINGRISKQFVPHDSMAIEFWVKNRPDQENNHFKVNLTEGEYSPNDNSFALMYEYDLLKIMVDGAIVVQENLDFSEDRWYQVRMERDESGNWKVYWDGDVDSLFAQDTFGALANPYFTVSSFSPAGEGGILFDDIVISDNSTENPADPFEDDLEYSSVEELTGAGWENDFIDWSNHEYDSDQFLNINLDPMLKADYQLNANSPCKSTGTNNDEMGAFGPTGEYWEPLSFGPAAL